MYKSPIPIYKIIRCHKYKNILELNIMKVLELFSGTGSVGKICKEMSWEVISLDLKGADINTNILNWDYTQYPVGHFDLIWASPPCDTFSQLRRTWVGKKLKCHHGEVCTHELLQHDIDTIGLPILRKTEEIIAYFNPKYYFIENPQTGHMKTYMMHHPHYDVDYCKYTDWGYKKRTRIWTNLKGFIPKMCTKDCDNIKNNKHVNFQKTKMNQNENGNRQGKRYRIPPQLIKDLFSSIIHVG